MLCGARSLETADTTDVSTRKSKYEKRHSDSLVNPEVKFQKTVDLLEATTYL